MSKPRKITRDDIMPMDEFAKIRKEKRQEIIEQKRNRRVDVGPHVTFYFENYDTMWLQIHDMLHIERGGEEQIKDELSAYNPLIPQGRDLSATMMFEIDNRQRREALLGRLGGVENTVMLSFDGHEVTAEPEMDVERSTEGGRTSSIHFLHFNFSDEAAEAFKKEGTKVTLEIGHEAYQHAAIIPERVRAALAEDLD
ncbi:MAG: DUF3501 family protein [Alphaproteobacteria bacterium]|nr:DUF3501 family protein [Alphaproteobacteria bacterium]